MFLYLWSAWIFNEGQFMICCFLLNRWPLHSKTKKEDKKSVKRFTGVFKVGLKYDNLGLRAVWKAHINLYYIYQSGQIKPKTWGLACDFKTWQPFDKYCTQAYHCTTLKRLKTTPHIITLLPTKCALEPFEVNNTAIT